MEENTTMIMAIKHIFSPLMNIDRLILLQSGNFKTYAACVISADDDIIETTMDDIELMSFYLKKSFLSDSAGKSHTNMVYYCKT